MAFSGLSLPNINENSLDDAKERRRILEHLYQLTEQLRYMLTHIDEDNLSEELSGSLNDMRLTGVALSNTVSDMMGNMTSIKQTAEGLAVTVSNVEGDVSQLRQTADGLSVTVGNMQGDVSTLQQTADGLLTTVSNVEGDVSLLQQTADGLLTTVSNVEGDVSTLRQTADGLAVTVGNVEGDVSALRQEADGLTVTVGNMQGDMSVLQQTADGLTTTVGNMEGDMSLLQQTANSLSSTVGNMQGSVSSLQQFANSLTLSVSNSTDHSTISLMAGGATIASRVIQMIGMVTFSNLSNSGQTVINGSNILTGTVAASRIDVDNLYVRHLNAADGSFTQLTAGYNGSTLIQDGYIRLSNMVEIRYTAGYNDITIQQTYSSQPYGNLGTSSRPWDYLAIRTINQVSSLRFKKNIRNITPEDYTGIDALRPITYENKDKADGRHLGFIAEEVELICPMLVSHDEADGSPIGLQYDRLTVLLVDEVKKLRTRVAALESSVT